MSKEHLPVILKIVSDAERQIKDLLGFYVRLEMKSFGGHLSRKDSVKARLQNLVCNTFEVSWSDIIGDSKKINVVNARRLYSFICYTELSMPITEIGSDINRHYSSVIHHKKTIKKSDPFGDIKKSIIADL